MPSNLGTWAAQVKRRDDYTCRGCGTQERAVLEAHHVLPKRKHPERALDVGNGITLCGNCHRLAHRGMLDMHAYGALRLPPKEQPKPEEPYVAPPKKGRRAWNRRPVPYPDGEPIVGMWRISELAMHLATTPEKAMHCITHGYVLTEFIDGSIYVLPESVYQYLEAATCEGTKDTRYKERLANLAAENMKHESVMAVRAVDMEFSPVVREIGR